MYRLISLIAAFGLLMSCEKEFIPNTTFEQPDLVVEGYVEHGTNANPPYLLLTKSTEYRGLINASQLSDLFVHDAVVTVFDGDTTIALNEICLNDLDSLGTGLRDAALRALGVSDPDSLDGFNICLYTNLDLFIGLSSFQTQPGKSYTLTIKTGDKTVSAVTTLPFLVPIDSITHVNHPGYPSFDSLVELQAFFKDPVGPNYYRSFTKQNNDPMYASGTRGTNGSVSDDLIFEGQSFLFPVLRGQAPNAAFDFDTYGYFWRGDTIVFRAASIDYNHFRFWKTLEYNTGSQGPFGSYTRVESNVEGALGLWGGIAFEDYTYVIPN